MKKKWDKADPLFKETTSNYLNLKRSHLNTLTQATRVEIKRSDQTTYLAYSPENLYNATVDELEYFLREFGTPEQIQQLRSNLMTVNKAYPSAQLATEDEATVHDAIVILGHRWDDLLELSEFAVARLEGDGWRFDSKTNSVVAAPLKGVRGNRPARRFNDVVIETYDRLWPEYAREGRRREQSQEKREALVTELSKSGLYPPRLLNPGHSELICHILKNHG